MNREEAQARIDSIPWYHEFDFGNGLQAKSNTHAEYHREVWSFIENYLDGIDFAGKTVLDIGCWDGYWSFYAERRGAARVLATDDCSQNWANGGGLRLAHELLGSRVEINQRLSVYELATLNQTFDIILCLGVYYHLLDPFYAYSQIRHCCHPGTIVILEGDGIAGNQPDALYVNLDEPAGSIYQPSAQVLRQQLTACYLNVNSQTWWPRMHGNRGPAPAVPGRLGWRWRLRMCGQALAGSREGVAELTQQVAPYRSVAGVVGRMITDCRPFEGANPVHVYKPPFGLQAYDHRFRTATQAA